MESAQPIPGPTTEVLSAKAREHHSWVAMSLLERAGEDVFNTAVLVDREGRIAGKYRKAHLPLEEAERGVTPGREYAVFDTDFGKVGMLVCWDHWFTESVRILRLKGAEMVLLPVAGDIPQHWDVISRARAMDNGVYVAVLDRRRQPAQPYRRADGRSARRNLGWHGRRDRRFRPRTARAVALGGPRRRRSEEPLYQGAEAGHLRHAIAQPL